jgi:hypothetical protein
VFLFPFLPLYYGTISYSPLTKKVLENFFESNIKYLFTSTHINSNTFLNKDILSADFRLIDLFSAPYNFPINPLYRISDWIYPEPEREMCLWSREQVGFVLKNFGLNF